MSVSWPNIREPHPQMCRTKIVKAAHRFATEAGTKLTRAKYTGAKRVFTLGWDAMTIVDFDVLVTFFTNYQGSQFTWTHYKTGTSYTCVFMQDELPEAEYVGSSHVTLSGLIIAEA